MPKLKQDDDYGIGENLVRLRKKQELRQKDVIAQLGMYGIHISRNTYSKMEHDNYPIKIKELMALACIFKCKDFNQFFIGVQYPEKLV